MAKKQLTATTPAGTFMRTTDHPYTYVVVSVGESRSYLQGLIRNAQAHPARHENEEQRRHSMQRLQERIARVDAGQDTGTSVTWHSKLSLAQVVARQRQAFSRTVNIYPVDQPATRPVEITPTEAGFKVTPAVQS